MGGVVAICDAFFRPHLRVSGTYSALTNFIEARRYLKRLEAAGKRVPPLARMARRLGCKAKSETLEGAYLRAFSESRPWWPLVSKGVTSGRVNCAPRPLSEWDVARWRGES